MGRGADIELSDIGQGAMALAQRPQQDCPEPVGAAMQHPGALRLLKLSSYH